MVLPMPFSFPHGGEEIVAKKKWYIVSIMVLQTIFLPFLFMTSDFTVGSGVMQIFILIFAGLTLYTNDLGQMVPWAVLAGFEFVFGLVAIIFQATRGPGPELYGGNTWVRTKLAFGFEIANVVLLACIVALTWWTYKQVQNQSERLPLNVDDTPAANPRQTSSFSAFQGSGRTLGEAPSTTNRRTSGSDV